MYNHNKASLKLLFLTCVLIAFKQVSYSQTKETFFAIVSENTFDASIIAKMKIKSVMIYNLSQRERMQEEYENDKIYFNEKGLPIKIEVIHDGKVFECYRKEKLKEYYSNLIREDKLEFFKNDIYSCNWSNSKSEGINDSVKNVKTEMWACQIKQTYFNDDGLPTTINELYTPAYQNPLSLHWFYYYTKDSISECNCLTPYENQQLTIKKTLFKDSILSETYINSAIYNDSLESRFYLKNINSFWDFFPHNALDSTRFEVVSFTLNVISKNGFSCLQTSKSCKLNDMMKENLMYTNLYSLESIRLYDRKYYKEIEMNGFRKRINNTK